MNQPAIQIHPMVPLAKACAILKINRDELIKRLSSGELLGEKRRIGESKKDSWFIYAHEFDRLATQAVAKYEERVSIKGMEHVFSSEPGVAASRATPPVVAALPPPAVAELVAETVQIDPVALDQNRHDAGEIVDALGSDYALGAEYEDTTQSPADFSPPSLTAAACALQTAQDSDQHFGQAMVAQLSQLMQHLQDERHQAEQLRSRMLSLEDEVDNLRRELLERSEPAIASPFARIKRYFRLLLT